MNISSIQQYTKATILCNNTESDITELLIDSRRISQPEKSLFIAIVARRNGHDFINDAYQKGVRNFLISEDIVCNNYTDAVFLKVPNTLDALQQIAIAHRKALTFPIVGITGSNGKTIVKELLYQLLSELPKYRKKAGIVRSPKSYNSQIGVPLSVWLMQNDNTLGIIEAGISQPKEMQQLEEMIKPDIGIITNIGEAHNEGFNNTKQKIDEKLLLFTHAKQMIYCKDYSSIDKSVLRFKDKVQKNNNHCLQLFTWSEKTDADLRITSIVKDNEYSTIHAIYCIGKERKTIHITIPYTDKVYIENAIHCWCVMLLLGIDDKTITAKMTMLHAVAMRLELKQGDNNCTIINDTYNSDVTSLKIALDFLEQQKHHAKKTLILSDILQVGKPDEVLYEEIASMINRRNVNRLIGIGKGISKYKSIFKTYNKYSSIFYKTTDDFIKNIHKISFEDEAVLLKGARAFRFEKIEKILEQKIHKTILEINLSSISHNLNVYRSQLKKGTKIMAMVKAFSYGNGSYEIANLLQYEGVDYLAVAYTDEGVTLRKAGITLPIMVMSPESGSFDRMITWQLEPEIFNIQSLRQFIEMASAMNVNEYPIHVKLDTGMHRLGFAENDIDNLCDELLQTDLVKVASVFSHLAGSDTTLLDDFTQLQSQRFEKMTCEIINRVGYKPILHLTNTAGISRHQYVHYDMVRLGIGLYGYDANEKIQKKLHQISTLKTIIAQIKELQQGETVGYSRNGKINRASKIATVAIGYADGYYRILGNGNAYMLVNGKPAPVIGNVCMDMCMIDITDIEDVDEGDEVIVFNDKLTITQLATWAGTIPYEIMTGISQRVKRIFINE